MANTDAFAIQRSDLNGFLFADVGVESNGMTLSVLSTLARLGLDPWDEAGRLAHQPRPAAVDALSRMIAALPSSLWPLPDSTPIAARLVALLPSRGTGSSIAAPVKAAQAATLGKQLIGMVPGLRSQTGREPSRVAAPSMTVLVVLAMLLAGLSAYLIGQRAMADRDTTVPMSETTPAGTPTGSQRGGTHRPSKPAEPTPTPKPAVAVPPPAGQI